LAASSGSLLPAGPTDVARQAKMLTRDEAQWRTVNYPRLPELLGPIAIEHNRHQREIHLVRNRPAM
jgi:hypothetical protein